MNGRMMHDLQGNLSFLPYGKKGQFINSISRAGLNGILLTAAEGSGVNFFFNHKCVDADIDGTSLIFEEQGTAAVKKVSADAVIGADGSWSAVRAALQHTDRFTYSQTFIDHGYKEFHIPPGSNIEKNAFTFGHAKVL